jgi:hypothetical protein
MSLEKSHKICSGLIAGIAIAGLAVSVALGDTGAVHHGRHTVVAAHRAHHAEMRRHWRSARSVAPIYGYAPETPPIPPNAIVGPGYTFIPGRGIVGESCDMPTSTCSNEYRDVQ